MNYWREALESSLDEHCPDVRLTVAQAEAVAKDLENAHQGHSMAFYTPPASDRLSEIEGEYKKKLNALQAEFDAYRGNAEKAVKVALRQYSDSNVSIGEDGEVFRNDGRRVQIQ